MVKATFITHVAQGWDLSALLPVTSQAGHKNKTRSQSKHGLNSRKNLEVGGQEDKKMSSSKSGTEVNSARESEAISFNGM